MRIQASLVALVVAVAPAAAQPRNEHRNAPRTVEPRGAQPQHQGRATGTIARPRQHEPINARTNSPHVRYYRNAQTGREEHHPIVMDHRPAHVISRDAYARRFARDYRPRRSWEHFYPDGGWRPLWGINDWSNVGTVTCEAADESTGALYPVTAPRAATGWDDVLVDRVLDQALDECAAAVGPERCVAVTPACTFEGY